MPTSIDGYSALCPEEIRLEAGELPLVRKCLAEYDSKLTDEVFELAPDADPDAVLGRLGDLREGGSTLTFLELRLMAKGLECFIADRQFDDELEDEEEDKSELESAWALLERIERFRVAVQAAQGAEEEVDIVDRKVGSITEIDTTALLARVTEICGKGDLGTLKRLLVNCGGAIGNYYLNHSVLRIIEDSGDPRIYHMLLEDPELEFYRGAAVDSALWAGCLEFLKCAVLANRELKVAPHIIDQALKAGQTAAVAFLLKNTEQEVTHPFLMADFIHSAIQEGRLEPETPGLVELDEAVPGVGWNLAARVAGKGELELLKALVAHHGLDVTGNGNEAAACAARAGHLHVLEWLVRESGQAVDLTVKGNRVLRQAAAGGHLHVVKWLVEASGQPVTVTAKDSDAACAALITRNFELVEWLVEQSGQEADITADYFNACHCVLRDDEMHYDRLRRMTKVPILKEKELERFEEELYAAVLKQQHGKTESLLGRLGESNRRHALQRCARRLILEGNHPIVAELIREKRLQLELEGGANAVLNALVEDGHLETVKWLVKESGQEVLLTLDHNKPLRTAAEKGHLALVQWLVRESGQEVDVTADDNAVLDIAASEGHLEIIKWLVKESGRHVDVTAGDNKALIQAVQSGHRDVVAWLVRESGAAIDLTANEHRAFIEAVNAGRSELVKWMLEESGQRIDVTAREGEALVKTQRDPELFKLLVGRVERGADLSDLFDRIVEAGNIEAASWLLRESGHSIDISAEAGRFLSSAVACGRLKMLQWLAAEAGLASDLKAHSREMISLAKEYGTHWVEEWLRQESGETIAGASAPPPSAEPVALPHPERTWLKRAVGYGAKGLLILLAALFFFLGTVSDWLMHYSGAALARQETGKAVLALKGAALLQDTRAKVALAMLYEMQVPPDREEAYRYYKGCADDGSIVCMERVAEESFSGDGPLLLQKDHKTALLYYERLAKMGDLQAQYRVSQIYTDGGFGVEGNRELGALWLAKARETEKGK